MPRSKIKNGKSFRNAVFHLLSKLWRRFFHISLQITSKPFAFTDDDCPKCPNGRLKKHGFMIFLVIIRLPCLADDVIRAVILLLTRYTV